LHLSAAQRANVLLGVLVTVAAYFLIWPAWRAQFPLEIWPTESWSAYFQDAAGRLQPIYAPADALVSNNYPPLSFYVIGGLSRLLGDALFVGRALSLVALLVTATQIARAGLALGADWRSAAMAAAWFVALMAHHSLNYVGANDPQLAGQAIMAAGLAWFLRRERDGASCLAPLLVMVLAGFWKHNIVAIPLTATVWLVSRRAWAAADDLLVVIVAVSAGLGFCGYLFGPGFFANLLERRAYSAALILPHLGHLQWVALALVIWLLWLRQAWPGIAARFTALHVGISLLVCIVQWSGDGVAQNAEFDLMIALAVALSQVLATTSPLQLRGRRFSAAALRDVVIVLLVVRLVATPRHEPALVLFSPAFRNAFAEAAVVVDADTARVAALPGDVFCDNKTICRRAGKPFVADEFRLEQMIATGELTQQGVDGLLARRGVVRFRSDPRTIAENVTRQARSRATGQ
jgi:hypothetical protein